MKVLGTLMGFSGLEPVGSNVLQVRRTPTRRKPPAPGTGGGRGTGGDILEGVAGPAGQVSLHPERPAHSPLPFQLRTWAFRV